MRIHKKRGWMTLSDSSWNDGNVSIHQSSSSISSGSSGKYSSIMDDGTPHPSPLIKAGWLDKNPPQGSYIYQKRWVKLDVEYLRYYDSDKDMYSKRFIPVNVISRVTNIGDQKFEVTTQNRTFVFRSESDADRSDWVRAFEQVIRDRRNSMSQSGCPVVDTDKAGLLELKGYKSKPYVVVAGDKVFIYKNIEDFRMGIGVTLIEMNVGNVRDTERKGFDLTTPYKIFSFTADSDTEQEEWVEAMHASIAEALSCMEVAEKMWSVEANRYCAECGAPNPDWASINLCVVFCKRCAGEHRSLGPGVSKVRSLKMDRKIWTEDLIQLFQRIGNTVANQFWAANVPESEAIHPRSSCAERKRFIASKYKEGKYRRYHQLFGNQEELNKALCAAVTTSDLAETLSLVFCGAEVACYSGDPAVPSPAALAEQAGQRLQMQFLFHNKNSELPRVDVGNNMEKLYYVARPSISHNGFLYKTASMSRAVSERKSREEFSRRWCVLNDGVLSYFESDKNLTPNGEIKMSEIVCLVVNSLETHGYPSTFEIYTESDRLYLFGSDEAAAVKEWVKSIAKSFISSRAEDLVIHDFERIGRLPYTARLGQESSKLGWFALVLSTLYACMEESEREELIHLKKLSELSIKGDNDNVLILGEKTRTLYIQGERKLAFSCWVSAIQKAAGTTSDTLSGQQLTESNIPIIVYRCIDYITRYGLTSEGIYRKSGQNSKTTNLLQLFKKDARGVWLLDGEHQVDDVANTLKRFFRYIGEGIFMEFHRDWLSTPAINYDVEKVREYQQLLRKLPPVNKATLKALINHLYCVQNFSSSNQMNTHNLAIVFGPTLFQTDGQDNKPGQVVEDLIDHYVGIFSVGEQELRTQREELEAIKKIKEACQPSRNTSRDFICSVFFEEKSEDKEHNIQIPASMTADQVTFEILDRRQVQRKEKDCWSCFEVNEKEEIERPLHYCEKVLPIYQSLGTDGCLVVKKHLSMEAMLIYLASKVEDTKHGMMKFYEERSLMKMALNTGSFHDRYFILNNTSLRLYKEVRNPRRPSLTVENSHKPDREWPVKNIAIHLGIKKKIRPPTCWGFSMIYENERHEKSTWYLCCDTQPEMREWFATFLHVQHGGNVWPLESAKVQVSRIQRDSKLGNLSLIPLRGNANEMRNSVAAFTSDPLTLIREV